MILDKKQIRVIFFFKFKAAETILIPIGILKSGYKFSY